MPTGYFQPLSRYGTSAPGGRNPFLGSDILGGGGNVYPSWAALVGGTQWNNDQAARAASEKKKQDHIAKFGVPPPGADPDRWYAQKEAAAQYTPIEVTKNQWLKDFVGGLQTDLTKASATMPDFSTLLADLKKDQGGIGASFNRYDSAMNLDDYIAAQRGGDAELRARTAGLGGALSAGDAEARARTDALAGQVGAMSDRYGNVLAEYERRGAGALGDELANARDFSGRLIPQAIQDAYSQVQKNAKLYDFATPGGYSSGAAGRVASESTRAALPFMLEGSRYTGNVLGKYQPFYSDVAARQAGKIAGFDYPAAAAMHDRYGNLIGQERANASAMYDRYGNVIGQEKATAANIQQLQMSVAREGVDMAIKRFVTDFQSAQMMAQAANLPVQVIMERAQAAGVLGGMSSQYQYEGLQGPDAFLQSPTGQNNTLPGYPSRYGTTVGTGNTGAGPAGPVRLGNENLPSWMRGWTPGQIDAHYQNYISQNRSNPNPGNPNPGNWGFVNGEYVGQDADAWNENMYGPIVN